jgi:hypothetical protein
MRRLMIIGVTALCLALSIAAPGEAQQQMGRRYRVLAHVTESTIISGQSVKVVGKVKPLAIGRRVILQKRYKKRTGEWRKVMVRRIGPDGKFRLFDTPKTARKRFYRVVKPASDGHPRGVSDKMKVRVVPWDGRLNARLTWDGDADLDLVMYDASWNEISAAKPGPSNSGGLFDPDSTVGCGVEGSFERIYWPDQDAPVGRYHIYVEPKEACTAPTSTPWRLEVRVSGRLVKTVVGSGSEYNVAVGGIGRW